MVVILICVYEVPVFFDDWRVMIYVVTHGMSEAWMEDITVKPIRMHISRKNPAHG
jgi:hypothetical protein